MLGRRLLLKIDSLYYLCHPVQVAPAVCQNGVVDDVPHPMEP